MSTKEELIASQLANGSLVSKQFGDAFFIVTAYGIFPDGTDVTNKLQALVNIANSYGRTAIFFPHGNYFVTQINNDQNIYYFGDNAKFVGGYTKKIYQIGEAPSSSLVVNVKDYGAKGDGIADDTAAIQNAINFAHNVTGDGMGKEVYFPTGTYLCGDILLKDKVSLTGPLASYDYENFKYMVRLQAKSGATFILNSNQAHGVTIKNLLFDGNVRATAGISSSLESFLIDNCFFTGCNTCVGKHDGVIGQIGVITNCYMRYSNVGIENFYDTKISSNFLFSLAKAIYFIECGQNSIVNNKIEWNTLGIVLEGSDRTVIANNIFDNSEDVALKITNSLHVVVNGNLFQYSGKSMIVADNSDAHILLSGSKYIAISGNSFTTNEWETPQTHPAFIATALTSSDVIFSGNDMTGFLSTNLMINSLNSDVVIKGNINTYKKVLRYLAAGTNFDFVFWVNTINTSINASKTYVLKIILTDANTGESYSSNVPLFIKAYSNVLTVKQGTVQDTLGTGNIGSKINIANVSISTNGNKLLVNIVNASATAGYTVSVEIE